MEEGHNGHASRGTLLQHVPNKSSAVSLAERKMYCFHGNKCIPGNSVCESVRDGNLETMLIEVQYLSVGMFLDTHECRIFRMLCHLVF